MAESGAGGGNRTLVCSLGSCRSTIELRPRAETTAKHRTIAKRTQMRQAVQGGFRQNKNPGRKRPGFVAVRDARLELVVQTDAEKAVRERNGTRRRRAGEVILVHVADVQVLALDGPARHNGVFDASTEGVTAGELLLRESSSRRFDICTGVAARGEHHHAVGPSVADTATNRREVLFGQRSAGDRAVVRGVGEITFDAVNDAACLPVVAEGAADVIAADVTEAAAADDTGVEARPVVGLLNVSRRLGVHRALQVGCLRNKRGSEQCRCGNAGGAKC